MIILNIILNIFIISEQEVFGMYAFGFSDPTRVSEDWCSIRNLALQYVKEIRSIQPEGPYYLGGYSVGGLIALEIATIFLEEQEPVGLLVMIDTFPWVPEARGNTKKLRDAGSFGSDKVKVRYFSDVNFYCNVHYVGVRLIFIPYFCHYQSEQARATFMARQGLKMNFMPEK